MHSQTMSAVTVPREMAASDERQNEAIRHLVARVETHTWAGVAGQVANTDKGQGMISAFTAGHCRERTMIASKGWGLRLVIGLLCGLGAVFLWSVVPGFVLLGPLAVIAVLLLFTRMHPLHAWLASPYPHLVFLGTIGYVVKPVYFFLYPHEVSDAFTRYGSVDRPVVAYVVLLFAASVCCAIVTFRVGVRLLKVSRAGSPRRLCTTTPRKQSFLLGIICCVVMGAVAIAVRAWYRGYMPGEIGLPAPRYLVGFMVHASHFGLYVFAGTAIMATLYQRRGLRALALAVAMFFPALIDTMWGSKGAIAGTSLFLVLLLSWAQATGRLFRTWFGLFVIGVVACFLVVFGFRAGLQRRNARVGGEVENFPRWRVAISPLMRVSGFELAMVVVDACRANDVHGEWTTRLLSPITITNLQIHKIPSGHPAGIAISAVGHGYLAGGPAGVLLLFGIAGLVWAVSWNWACGGGDAPSWDRFPILLSISLLIIVFIQEGGAVIAIAKILIVIGVFYVAARLLLLKREEG